MTLPTSERLAKVHASAVTGFDRVQQAQRPVRIECLEDRRFYSIAGAMWEGDLADQFANKPKMEVNKVHLAVIRIINEYRNNRITVSFTPKDGKTGDKMADTLDGLFRADEKDSVAEEAYDNAFEESVGGGMGAWRLRACLEDEDNEDNEQQRVRMEPIFDADTSVYFDLQAKRQDKADATECWVLSSMTVDSYVEKYGDDPASWPKDTTRNFFDWATPDVVFVAEYYKVEEKKELVHIYRGLTGEEMEVPDAELKEDEKKAEELLATGFKLVRQRRRKTRKVHKYIMSGSKVLEDCGYIAGKFIPIIISYGKRWFVDNVERCMGHVRLAKDPSRLKNMQISKLAEISALSSVEKPIVTPQQMTGHEDMWAKDNIENYPYLLLNPVTDADGNQTIAPMGYTKSPSIPQAMAALLQLTETDMQDILGNQGAGEKMVSNIGEKTVEMIQTHLDMQAFIYMSNHAKAKQHSGRVWLSMMKDIAVEERRVMKTVDSRDQVGSVTLNVESYDPETSTITVENDLSSALMDVWADVGPSSSSQRASTVRSLTSMMTLTQDPATLNVLTAAVMMNIEGEGLTEINEYFRRKLVADGVLKPTDEEAAEIEAAKANQPPDPNTVFLLKSAAAQEAKAQSDQAGAVQKLADAKLKEAQTDKTIAETQGEHTSQEIGTLQALQSIQQPAPPSA